MRRPAALKFKSDSYYITGLKEQLLTTQRREKANAEKTLQGLINSSFDDYLKNKNPEIDAAYTRLFSLDIDQMKLAVSSKLFDVQAKILNFIVTGVSEKELKEELQKLEDAKEESENKDSLQMKFEEIGTVYIRNGVIEDKVSELLAPLQAFRPDVLSVYGGKFRGKKIFDEGSFVVKLTTVSSSKKNLLEAHSFSQMKKLSSRSKNQTTSCAMSRASETFSLNLLLTLLGTSAPKD